MRQAATTSVLDRFIGRWVWLLPLTYLLHIAEEYWGGEGFYRWLSRVAGVELTPEQFLSLNATAWVVMAAGVAVVYWAGAGRWLVVAFGTAVLLNGLLHLGGSLLTWSYSPGLVSGLLCWLPLGAATLRRAWRVLPGGAFACGVVAGAGLQGLISLLALGVL